MDSPVVTPDTPLAVSARPRTIQSPLNAAVKLVIGQHLYFSRQHRFWAWLIVAGFYDADNYELWHTEIFICSRDTHGWDSVIPRESGEGPSLSIRALDGELPLSWRGNASKALLFTSGWSLPPPQNLLVKLAYACPC